MIVKLLNEYHLEFLGLKGGCRGSSESTHVKIPHCWKSHALAQILLNQTGIPLKDSGNLMCIGNKVRKIMLKPMDKKTIRILRSVLCSAGPMETTCLFQLLLTAVFDQINIFLLRTTK